MQEIMSFLEGYIDIAYMGSFILLSYAFLNTVTDVVGKAANKKRPAKQYGVLIIGVLVGILFFYLNRELYDGAQTDAEIIKKLIASYAIGTSLYELIIKWLVGTIKKKLNIDDDKPKTV